MNSRTDWLTVLNPERGSGARLFCFPYAGGGSLIFRRWLPHLKGTVELCAAQFPGRETRMRESPVSDLRILIDALAREIKPFLDRPYAFFGHSMGALVAFELARRLRSEGAFEPVHLFLSGRRAPHLPKTDRALHTLPEVEFIEEVIRLNGTPREVLTHPELMQILVPLLRADFAVCQTYKYAPQPPLRSRITALGGLQDDWIDHASLDAWREHTSSHFAVRMFPGDHFFLNQTPELPRIIAHDLARSSADFAGRT
ncbi:MAG TPA: alpha/beta fold hydrolase [Pyrinomonadaceae bacterium]|nr:alpha/beta fold hydrolase [Pyrinomonadaceae bacterium]